MFDIRLDRESDIPLYAQIRDGIIKAIKDNKLDAGSRLPAVAVFSKQLGVTQTTILRAFEDLIEAGYMASHVGRGSFVTDPSDNSANRNIKDTLLLRSPLEPFDPELTIAARRLRMGAAKSLEALQVLSRRPGLIQFSQGVPDISILQPGLLSEMTLEALKRDQAMYQDYGDPMGMLELREIISQKYKSEGVDISPEEILITSGSQQAISLIAQYALENNYRTICESPCYQGVPNAFGAIGHWVETIPRDRYGPIPEKLKAVSNNRNSLLYFCPEMHNPMGTDISVERMKIFVNWAKENKILLIADEIYHDLRIEGEAPVSILSNYGKDNSIVVGSLSKSFICGLRIGWLITGKDRINSLIGLKRAMDIACPPLMQGIALASLATGKYGEHIIRAREHYKIRMDATHQALKKNMPAGVSWTIPNGGFQLWVEMPSGYSSITLYLLAIEKGVVIIPGPQMDVDHRFTNGFRLAYGSLEVHQIVEGIELLAAAVKDLLKGTPGEPGLSGLGDFLY